MLGAAGSRPALAWALAWGLLVLGGAPAMAQVPPAAPGTRTGAVDPDDPEVAEEAEEEPASEREAFAARRAALLGTRLDDVRLTSTHDQEMRFGAVQGRWLLLAFADRNSRQEAISWFEQFSEQLARTPNLVVFNLLFPGRVSFVVPRAVALRKIRKDVDRIMGRTREGLPEALRPAFDALLLRWHVDWKRTLIQSFGAPRNRLSLLLADPAGKVVAFADRVEESTLIELLERVRSR